VGAPGLQPRGLQAACPHAAESWTPPGEGTTGGSSQFPAPVLAATRRTATARGGAERNPGSPHPMTHRPNGANGDHTPLSRVPFQGTEDVVWRGPRGSTPYWLSPVAPSGHEHSTHRPSHAVPSSQKPVPKTCACPHRNPAQVVRAWTIPAGKLDPRRSHNLHPDVAYATSGCKSRRNSHGSGRHLQTRVAYATRVCKSSGIGPRSGSCSGRSRATRSSAAGGRFSLLDSRLFAPVGRVSSRGASASKN